MSLFTSDLYRKVLLSPPIEAEALYIVTGYASYAMAQRHIGDLQSSSSVKQIHTIVGMTATDGVLPTNHIGFKKLTETSNNRYDFLYIPDDKPPVHSKSYVWCNKDGKPLLAYVGSANYTQNAFLNDLQREILHVANPEAVFDYFKKIEKEAIWCTHIDAEGLIQSPSNKLPQNRNLTDTIQDFGGSNDTITLSLLKKGGGVGHGSGVNWGIRKSGIKREPNQAYISYPAEIRKNHPNFFPERGTQFTILTDDGKPIVCAIAQADGKAVESTENNSILGLFIRSRMGLPSGHFITEEDFNRYGRSDVTITKIDDENFLLDFSV